MIMIWNAFSLSAPFARLENLEYGFQNTNLLPFPLLKCDFVPCKLFHFGNTGLCTKTNLDSVATDKNISVHSAANQGFSGRFRKVFLGLEVYMQYDSK